MSDLEFPDVLMAAARATIHERFAPAYLHDVRGTMQALFSALELLARSAQSGSNPARIEKACDLAKRAISQHEKTTMGVLRLLMQEDGDPLEMDLGALVGEAVHFLRGDAAARQVKIVAAPAGELHVDAEHNTLQTMLVGLLAAAVDTTPAGAELHVAALRRGADAEVTIGSHAGYADFLGKEHSWKSPQESLPAHELTFLFAQRVLIANGGKLVLDAGEGPRGSLRVYYPLSLAETRASATAK